MISDPFREGLAAGWRHIDASTLSGTLEVEADVVIVGSGAGGGVSAEILANAGLTVVIVEEGPLRTTRDFRMRESEAYPALYQESAARKTADKAINILQGRCVGGSTTVNWTSSFRTPPATLQWWQTAYGLRDLTVEELAPWFSAMEARLHIGNWPTAPNANNSLLATGAARLGIATNPIRRNVRGCWDLGYCGMGCPTNAKQSMLLTTLPAALSRGAALYSHLRAERLVFNGRQVERLEAQALAADGLHPGAAGINLRARHFVLAGGAINSPALLLRSRAPDPGGLAGTRTFLHPTVISSALFDEPVRAHAGAPQSVYSDHFLDKVPIDGPLGYKLEVAPLHPVLFATTLQGWGENHRRMMEQFSHCQSTLALLRDGFHPESQGGRVRLRKDGSPLLDYPLNDPLWDGVRRALLTMAEIQFAAGARWVTSVHETAPGWKSWAEARAGIAALRLAPLVCRVVSAHVMGGCAMADSPQRGLTDSHGRHFHLDNLSVLDGSVFPTSIGANPQLSIYGLVARNATSLAASLTGRPKPATL